MLRVCLAHGLGVVVAAGAGWLTLAVAQREMLCAIVGPLYQSGLLPLAAQSASMLTSECRGPGRSSG